jgi:hypothetical protein
MLMSWRPASQVYKPPFPPPLNLILTPPFCFHPKVAEALFDGVRPASVSFRKMTSITSPIPPFSLLLSTSKMALAIVS